LENKEGRKSGRGLYEWNEEEERKVRKNCRRKKRSLIEPLENRNLRNKRGK